MANDQPALALFAFAAVFGFGAFLYIRYPDKMKRWKEASALFEFQRRIIRIYSAQNYRTIGWLLAVCAALMLTGAVIALFT